MEVIRVSSKWKGEWGATYMAYMIRELGLGLRGLSLPKIILFPIMLEISPSDKSIFKVTGWG